MSKYIESEAQVRLAVPKSASNGSGLGVGASGKERMVPDPNPKVHSFPPIRSSYRRKSKTG